MAMGTYKDKRREPRETLDQYHSVEIPIEGLAYSYQFKIWDKSPKGLCVVVKEDSEFLKHLKVGDILEMKYYGEDYRRPAEYMKTEVRHITKNEAGRFKGHYLVGISVLKKEEKDK
jgi:hypothetical protein